jgi:anti-sigma B factor antagonist
MFYWLSHLVRRMGGGPESDAAPARSGHPVRPAPPSGHLFIDPRATLRPGELSEILGPSMTGEARLTNGTADSSSIPRTVLERVTPFSVTFAETASGTVVRVEGDASVVSVDRLQTALSAVADRRPEMVVLDLADLSYLSGLAMGTLVDFRRRIVRAEGRVRLAAVPPRVLCALHAVGLTKLFGIYETTDEALGRPASDSDPLGPRD